MYTNGTLTPNEKMAARDLAAAATAVKNGRNLTALTLALDALASLTASAAEGHGAFIPFGDEVAPAQYARKTWSEDTAREIHKQASDLLNKLPTLWSSVKSFREAAEQPAPLDTGTAGFKGSAAFGRDAAKSGR